MVRIVILGEQAETLSMLAEALRQGGYQVRVVSTFKWKMSVLKYLSPHFVIVARRIHISRPRKSAAGYGVIIL